jgi:hypothetical protein
VNSEQRRQRITEFDEQLRAGGLEGPTDNEVDIGHQIGVAGGLPDYERTPNTVCGICVRSMHPQRKVEIDGYPGHYACRYCAGLDQDPVVLAKWLAMPIERRRRLTAQHHGFDPADLHLTASSVTFAEVGLDVDGLPSQASFDTSRHRRLPGMGVPRSFWHDAPRRGWPTGR